MLKEKTIYSLLVLLSALWCGMIIFAPYLKSVHSPYSPLAYFCFSGICHQMPERSFYIFGEKLAVCERCAAIYFSFFMGVVLYPLIKKINFNVLRSALIFSMIIIVIDFLFGYIKLFQNMFTVLFSGALFGLCAAYFITSGLIKSFTSSKTSGGNSFGK